MSETLFERYRVGRVLGAQALAARLGCSADWILTGSESGGPPSERYPEREAALASYRRRP